MWPSCQSHFQSTQMWQRWFTWCWVKKYDPCLLPAWIANRDNNFYSCIWPISKSRSSDWMMVSSAREIAVIPVNVQNTRPVWITKHRSGTGHIKYGTKKVTRSQFSWSPIVLDKSVCQMCATVKVWSVKLPRNTNTVLETLYSDNTSNHWRRWLLFS